MHPVSSFFAIALSANGKKGAKKKRNEIGDFRYWFCHLNRVEIVSERMAVFRQILKRGDGASGGSQWLCAQAIPIRLQGPVRGPHQSVEA